LLTFINFDEILDVEFIHGAEVPCAMARGENGPGTAFAASVISIAVLNARCCRELLLG
jgi:hypothetical protein